MWRQLKTAAAVLVLMTILTGALYPLLVTAAAQRLFPHQANGSLIARQGKTMGSELIGQSFDDPRYFWGRLSATTPAYNAAASSGSNYGPMNEALTAAARARIEALRRDAPDDRRPIPVDLVTSSGSGLDGDISVAAALYQVQRVARTRKLNAEDVRAMVMRHVEDRQLGFLGEKRVNVLKMNLSLDGLE
jgi:potassium-transporting ATPase KdpC subunit